MRISIHQPHYLPWLRYFDKIARSDCFVVLDDAQFNRNGYQNRNRVKGPEGGITLTVPILQHYQQSLLEVQCNNTVKWQTKHWRTIEQHYRNAPFFESCRSQLAPFYRETWPTLTALNRAMLKCFLQMLGITTRVVESHEMGVGTSATTRLIEICRSLNATSYLSGAHAVGAYLQPEAFECAGIALEIHWWTCPEYEQRYPKAGFVPDLAILDLLMNHGPGSLEVLQSKSGVASALEVSH